MSENPVIRGVKFDIIAFGVNLNDSGTNSYIHITTDAKAIQLLCCELKSPSHGYRCAPSNLKLQCNCKVSLTRITDYGTDTSKGPPVVFEFVKDVAYDSTFIMPFAETMKLEPYNKYKLVFWFNGSFPSVYANQKGIILEHQGLTISWKHDGSYQETHLRWFEYQTL